MSDFWDICCPNPSSHNKQILKWHCWFGRVRSDATRQKIKSLKSNSYGFVHVVSYRRYHAGRGCGEESCWLARFFVRQLVYSIILTNVPHSKIHEHAWVDPERVVNFYRVRKSNWCGIYQYLPGKIFVNAYN